MVNGRGVEDLQLPLYVNVPFCAKHFSTVTRGIGVWKKEVLILCYRTEACILKQNNCCLCVLGLRIVGVNRNACRRLLPIDYTIILPMLGLK